MECQRHVCRFEIDCIYDVKSVKFLSLQQESHIHRQCEQFVFPVYIVVSKFYCIIHMVFFRMPKDGAHGLSTLANSLHYYGLVRGRIHPCLKYWLYLPFTHGLARFNTDFYIKSHLLWATFTIESHFLYLTLRAKLHIFIQMTRVIVCFSFSSWVMSCINFYVMCRFGETKTRYTPWKVWGFALMPCFRSGLIRARSLCPKRKPDTTFLQKATSSSRR